jgi:hypothetical protein
MVDDNIVSFPRAIGPMLRDHHKYLLEQPFPQRLKDLLAMLEEACGSVDLAALADLEPHEPAVACEPLPEKSK